MMERAVRTGIAALIGFVLIAADAPSEPPPPPAPVAERIVDGRFEPGNFVISTWVFPSGE